ncbi:hypothetical protein J3F83DRAFT_756428 [Trichoderma novae-zelandiae]
MSVLPFGMLPVLVSQSRGWLNPGSFSCVFVCWVCSGSGNKSVLKRYISDARGAKEGVLVHRPCPASRAERLLESLEVGPRSQGFCWSSRSAHWPGTSSVDGCLISQGVHIAAPATGAGILCLVLSLQQGPCG